MTSKISKKNHTPVIRTREREPIAKAEKNGIVLMCPFCSPSHPLIPTEPSICGTTLRVTAIQEVVSARSARILGLQCVKCGEPGGGQGGEMVKYMNGFVHLKKCKPNMRLLTDAPKYSWFAKKIYHLPPSIRSLLEKRTGIVQVVKEITAEGAETGKVIGYFFLKMNKAVKDA